MIIYDDIWSYDMMIYDDAQWYMMIKMMIWYDDLWLTMII